MPTPQEIAAFNIGKNWLDNPEAGGFRSHRAVPHRFCMKVRGFRTPVRWTDPRLLASWCIFSWHPCKVCIRRQVQTLSNAKISAFTGKDGFRHCEIAAASRLPRMGRNYPDPVGSQARQPHASARIGESSSARYVPPDCPVSEAASNIADVQISVAASLAPPSLPARR